MDLGTVLLLALVFACPLLMLWMHGRGHGAGSGQEYDEPMSHDELRRLRREIDARLRELDRQKTIAGEDGEVPARPGLEQPSAPAGHEQHHP